MTKTLETVLALIVLTFITSIYGLIVVSLTPFTLDLGTIVVVALTASAFTLARAALRERRVKRLVQEGIVQALPAITEAAKAKTVRFLQWPRMGGFIETK